MTGALPRPLDQEALLDALYCVGPTGMSHASFVLGRRLPYVEARILDRAWRNLPCVRAALSDVRP